VKFRERLRKLLFLTIATDFFTKMPCSRKLLVVHRLRVPNKVNKNAPFSLFLIMAIRKTWLQNPASKNADRTPTENQLLNSRLNNEKWPKLSFGGRVQLSLVK
jgi:hypothetical protein